jgi:hypothetical protein
MVPTVQIQELVIASAKSVKLVSIMYTRTHLCLPFSLGLLKSSRDKLMASAFDRSSSYGRYIVQKLPVFYWVLDGNSHLNSAVGTHLLIQLTTLRWFTSSTCRHLPNWPTSLALIAGSVPITSAVGMTPKPLQVDFNTYLSPQTMCIALKAQILVVLPISLTS